MSSDANPTLRRRELAKYFRDLRHERGYQLEQVAEALRASQAKASRIESGARGISVEDVEVLSRFYSLPDAEHDRILAIARESRQRGWWQRVDLPPSMRTFIGMEQAALAINEYSTSVVPGLLQTPEYAAAIAPPDLPRADLVIEARLMRQAILRRPIPPELWVVIDESAITRIMGGAAVMHAQLRSLQKAALNPLVTVQLIPFEAGAHPGLNSDFILLRLSDDRLSDVVYTDGLIGSLFKDAPDDVRLYQRVWAQLRAIAMSPQDTMARVGVMADRLAP